MSRIEQEIADQNASLLPFSSVRSERPEETYRYLDEVRVKAAIEKLEGEAQ